MKKTALKIRIIHNRSKIKQTKNEQGKKKTSLKTHNNKKAYTKKYSNNNNNNKKQTNKQTNKRKKKQTKKIIQLLTEAPELVTLDCSFTHVLQAPNTQPYHI